ncbi:hypothetical protein DPMN_065192 [Dreissena polymorpha]|uniref:Uncharacterized protein n=1 Tax=Dreissena polymorpha TaxID=45954 RepID=A0A9D4CER9_DREPO|nr:hypothetical protein DPMN_065192 [Dreissena polymorpha]
MGSCAMGKDWSTRGKPHLSGVLTTNQTRMKESIWTLARQPAFPLAMDPGIPSSRYCPWSFSAMLTSPQEILRSTYVMNTPGFSSFHFAIFTGEVAVRGIDTGNS